MSHTEEVRSESFSLLDYSDVCRFGFRGKKVKSLLIENGFHPPEAMLTVNSTNQSLLLHLPHDEFWVLSAQPEMTLPVLESQADCYDIFCRETHAWFVLKADFKRELLSKLCAVNLSPETFPEQSIVQTFVAGCKTIIVHHKDAFSLLCDRTLAHGLWAALLDASVEYSQ